MKSIDLQMPLVSEVVSLTVRANLLDYVPLFIQEVEVLEARCMSLEGRNRHVVKEGDVL